MFTRLFIICIITLAVSGCGGDKGNSTAPVLTDAESKLLIQQEISHWEFAKLKNLGTLRNQLHPDYIGYFGTTALGPDATVATFKDTDIRSYRLSNIKVLPLTDNAAVVYYILDRDIVDGSGNPWAAKVAASETYVKVGKEWKAKYYQETMLEE